MAGPAGQTCESSLEFLPRKDDVLPWVSSELCIEGNQSNGRLHASPHASLQNT